jgi:Asp-tRNA(Asn)/Glu-tRNA(Gln) amidotransferase A subunit family amidase
MPAALCGVVGFKPTAGRLSNAGVLPLNWTVGMPGILAGTVEDALIASVITATPSFSLSCTCYY